MEYIPEIGLLVHDSMWALFIIVCTGYIVWLWPELSLAVFIFKPHIFYNLEFTAGFLGLKFFWDYVAMIPLMLKLWFMYTQQRGDHRLFRDPIVKYSLLLAGWTLVLPLLMFGMGARLLVIRQIQGYVIPILGILILARDKERLSRFLACAFGLLLVLQIMFVIDVLPMITEKRMLISRTHAIYGIPIWAANGEAAMLISLGYLLIPPRRKGIQVVCVLMLITSAFTVILGQSRGAWVSVLVTSMLMLTFTQRASKQLIFALLICCVIILLVNFAFPSMIVNVQNVVLEVFHIRYQATIEDATLSGRLVFWQNAGRSFLRSPIFGVGNDRAVGEIQTGSGITRPAVHNYFLAVLSEQGLIGFLMLLVILFRLFVVLKENWQTPVGSSETRRWGVLALAFTIYATLSLKVNYWAAALALVTNQRLMDTNTNVSSSSVSRHSFISITPSLPSIKGRFFITKHQSQMIVHGKSKE